MFDSSPTAIRSGSRDPWSDSTAAASLYKVQIDVAATGSDLRQLAATLDGRIRLEGTVGACRTHV